MFKQVIKPSPLLKSYIDYYYVLETDRLSESFTKQRIYPYGNIILVFHYNQPHLFQKRDQAVETEPRTVICGQQTTYYDLIPSGKTGMIFIVFKPYGAGQFFEMPMNEIRDKNVAFTDIVHGEATQIEEKIQNASGLGDRVGIIEQYLIKKLAQNKTDCRQIIASFNTMYQYNAQISVAKLADVACLSLKHYQRKFAALVGMNPKQFLQTVRFQNVLKIKNSGQYLNYTSLALKCGYYDQSHFINDFKTITDLTPKEFFKDIQSA